MGQFKPSKWANSEYRNHQSTTGATTTTFQYDSGNRRIQKKVGASAAVDYIWEGGHILAEYNRGTGTFTDYVWAGGRMVATVSGGTTTFLYQDRLSTRLSTNASGSVTGTQSHFPFGEDAGSTGTVEKHQFTTYERDSESGTDYAVNRQSGNGTGRFMRPDPIAGSTGNPQSLNRYAYALDDPLNFVDPLGLYCEPDSFYFIGDESFTVAGACYEVLQLFIGGINSGLPTDSSAGGSGSGSSDAGIAAGAGASADTFNDCFALVEQLLDEYYGSWTVAGAGAAMAAIGWENRNRNSDKFSKLNATGFNNDLVGAGQEGDVNQHILFSAGTTLLAVDPTTVVLAAPVAAGGALASVGNATKDFVWDGWLGPWTSHDSAQSRVEGIDDAYGMVVGTVLSGARFRSRSDVRDELRALLCK